MMQVLVAEASERCALAKRTANRPSVVAAVAHEDAASSAGFHALEKCGSARARVVRLAADVAVADEHEITGGI